MRLIPVSERAAKTIYNWTCTINPMRVITILMLDHSSPLQDSICLDYRLTRARKDKLVLVPINEPEYRVLKMFSGMDRYPVEKIVDRLFRAHPKNRLRESVINSYIYLNKKEKRENEQN